MSRSTLAAKINFVAKISHASARNSEDVFKTISSQNNPQDPPQQNSSSSSIHQVVE
ncbi:unnamed protein product [Brassica rapa subsp. trilocularis]